MALGAAGIIIPLLPTTPFLLLAGFFYIRSSQRLYKWLINHKIFGIYIYSYLTYKAIDMKSKIGLISLLWLSMGLSMYLVQNIYITLLLIVIGLGVSTHIMMLRTLNKKAMVLKRTETKNQLSQTKNALS